MLAGVEIPFAGIAICKTPMPAIRRGAHISSTRRPFRVVDRDHIHRGLFPIQLQPKLLPHGVGIALKRGFECGFAPIQ